LHAFVSDPEKQGTFLEACGRTYLFGKEKVIIILVALAAVALNDLNHAMFKNDDMAMKIFSKRSRGSKTGSDAAP